MVLNQIAHYYLQPKLCKTQQLQLIPIDHIHCKSIAFNTQAISNSS